MNSNDPRKQPVHDLKAPPSASSEAAISEDGEVAPASKLTPEEQMALFEKDLKENDWGHQPC